MRSVCPTHPEVNWIVDPNYDVVRAGYMQNPRLDVYADLRMGAGGNGVNFRNGNYIWLMNSGGNQDFDDMYAIKDLTTAGQFHLLAVETADGTPSAMDEFEEAGADVVVPPDVGVNVPLSKEDANIQPTRDFQHLTGWPSADRTPNTP